MSKRKTLTNEEFVKAFEKAFEGVNFDEQPAQDQGQSCYCPNCEALTRQVTALKTCLEVERGFREQEQPAQQQEPVATLFGSLPVYDTSPPASKPWVGLTNDEIALLNADYPHPQGFARAIEAKLREKNAQPSKPWVELTQEDRVEIWKKSASIDGAINATITKLREKNA